MINVEDLKIGDVINVNKSGEISEVGIEVTIFEKKEGGTLSEGKFYYMIGKTKDGRMWGSDYIKAP